MKRILIPVDFSSGSLRALEYALMLAELCHASLVLLHVLEPAGFGIEYAVLPPEHNGRLQSEIDAERRRLGELAHRRIGRHLVSETLVRVGRAWSEIPETAKALGADMIVLGVHGESSSRNLLVGGTAEGVMRHARCPVLLVP